MIRYAVMIFFLIFLSGCGMKKVNRVQQEAEVRSEEVREDSIGMRKLVNRLEKREIRMLQWVLDPPDTTGYQSVRTVTGILIKEDIGEDISGSVSAHSSKITHDEEKRMLDEREEVMRPGKRMLLPVVFLIVLLAVLSRLFRKLLKKC